MEEIEVKFLDIDVEKTKQKLAELGAVFVKKFDYKRKSYDFADKKLKEKHAWVRLRDEGEKVTLTYKQKIGFEHLDVNKHRVNEIEISVSDFDSTDKLLKEIGLEEKFYEENIRERYVLDGVEIDIDTWPLIPAYLEIEGKNWEEVKTTAEKLGFDWGRQFRGSAMQVYEMNGIDENSFSVLTFEQQIKR